MSSAGFSTRGRKTLEADGGPKKTSGAGTRLRPLGPGEVKKRPSTTEPAPRSSPQRSGSNTRDGGGHGARSRSGPRGPAAAGGGASGRGALSSSTPLSRNFTGSASPRLTGSADAVRGHLSSSVGAGSSSPSSSLPTSATRPLLSKPKAPSVRVRPDGSGGAVRIPSPVLSTPTGSQRGQVPPSMLKEVTQPASPPHRVQPLPADAGEDSPKQTNPANVSVAAAAAAASSGPGAASTAQRSKAPEPAQQQTQQQQKQPGVFATGSPSASPSFTPATAAARRRGRRDPHLPVAPHDGDSAYRRDSAHWVPEAKLPEDAAALLAGDDLEAPFTTSLWQQAYPSPEAAEAATSHSWGYAAERRASAAATQTATAEHPKAHRYAKKLTEGFYACLRCHNPVCAPEHQVDHRDLFPGMAVFSRLHAAGVTLEIRAAGLLQDATSGSRGRKNNNSSSSGPRVSRIGHNAAADGCGDIQFVVRCADCKGCLGRLTTDVPATLALGANGGAPVSELFFANSCCLEHLKHSTTADLDATMMDDTDDDNNKAGGSSFLNGGGAAGTFGDTPHKAKKGLLLDDDDSMGVGDDFDFGIDDGDWSVVEADM